MLYLVIGLVLAVAVGAVMTQRSRRAEVPQEPGEAADAENKTGEIEVPKKPEKVETSDLLSLSSEAPAFSSEAPQLEPAKTDPPTPQDIDASVPEIVPLKPLLAAEPISSPNALASATYSSSAPPSLSGDSPYSFVGAAEESKPEPTLLRWSGKTGSLQIGSLTIRGPVTYWSDGTSSTTEPSCIDITLPVEYPEGEFPNEGAASYAEMTPLMRGAYLLWLAGGRIQPPSHVCYPALWIFGLERRVLVDRLDIGICIGEAFRLLPLIRWDSLRQGLIKFVTWMAAKVWLPEEQLLTFCRALPTVPSEIFSMLLRPYVDAKLPLPSLIAFMVMRASPLARVPEFKGLQPPAHTDEHVAQFSSIYKSRCEGGVALIKPKSSLFVAYAPSNPSLSGEKNAVGGMLELPDFFKETENFAPLIAAWKEFLKSLTPLPPPTAVEEVEGRPDWASFTRRLQGLPEEGDEAEITGPLLTDLETLASLMRIEKNRKRPGGADRKKISDAARVEGFLVLPNLGIAGKEYHWEDPVILISLSAGDRPSQDYNAAAFLLEYASALTVTSSTTAFEDLRKRLDDYFSLSSDDHLRLESLSNLLLMAPEEMALDRADNLGECLQFWLGREQRGSIRDVLLRFLQPTKEGEGVRRITAICGSLDVLENEPPPVFFAASLEEGLLVSKVLAPLFKD